jgi:uncharacterized membrane protein
VTDTDAKADHPPAAEPDEPAELKPTPAPVKQDWWLRHYTFFGTAVGLVFIWFSMTPSLLPRGPLFQGLVSGAAGAIGYGLGVFVVWLVRFMRSKETSPPAPRRAWLGLLVVGIIGQVLAIVWFHVWQDEIRDFMGVPRLAFWDHPLTGVLSIVVLFAFVELGQLVGKLVRYLVRQLERVAPPRVSAVVVVVLLLIVAIALLNGSRHRRADHVAAVGRAKVAGHLVLARPPGPRLHGKRSDGRRADEVQRP